MIWKIRARELDLQKPRLVGILNVTPDSFSDGGRFLDPEKALSQGLRLIREGADVLDIGAESTRPGAHPVEPAVELGRILPLLSALRRFSDLPISIDTTKPEVAAACLKEGADIINDVSGLKDSGVAMAEAVREYGAGLILMHRRGNPRTMQSMAQYGDVVRDVKRELQESLDLAFRFGIPREQMVVDPGLGFAKTPEQNLEILARLEEFHEWGLPVLLGPSRKSFVGRVTGRSVEARGPATAAVVAYGVMKGIFLFRVHEVGPMRDVIQMIEAIQGADHVRTF